MASYNRTKRIAEEIKKLAEETVPKYDIGKILEKISE